MEKFTLFLRHAATIVAQLPRYHSGGLPEVVFGLGYHASGHLF